MVAIDDFLLEDLVCVSKGADDGEDSGAHSIFVPQAVTPGRVVESRKTVKVAGSKSTQTAIAQSLIAFLRNDIFEPETHFTEAFLGNVLEANVQHCIVEGTTHEEL